MSTSRVAAGAPMTRPVAASVRIALRAAPLALAIAAAGPASARDAAAVDLRRPFLEQPARPDALRAEGQEAPSATVATEQDGVTLRFAGQVNQALLYASQGGREQVFIADNDASGSRLEFRATAPIAAWTAGVEVVMSLELNSTAEIAFGDAFAAGETSAVGDLRQAHWFLEHPAYGTLSVGQGDTAAEDTMHADLSGTDFAGSGSDVDDIAGGLTFRAEEGAELAPLGDVFDALDGSRALRILYVSPPLAGFEIAASLRSEAGSLDADDPEVNGVSPALALRYGVELGGYEIEAATAWRRERTGSGGAAFGADVLTGSVSVLAPSGVSATLAGASGEAGGDTDGPVALFAKLGYIADWVEWGETRLSVDAFYGENAPDFASGDGDLPQASSYGAFAVQALADLNAELYIGARLYALDGMVVDGDEAEVDDLVAVITGARIRF